MGIKLARKSGLQADDGFVIFAAAGVVANAILHTVMAPISRGLGLIMFGLAQPGPNFLAEVAYYLRLQFAAITMFWNILWAVKFSLLIFIWRLTDGLPSMRKWWWGVFVFNIIMWASAIMSQYLNCRPLSTAFAIGPGACETLHPGTSVRAMLYAMAADIITDVTIMALPLRLLYGLKINKKQKFGLILIFSLGLLCVIFAIVRGVGSVVGNAIMPIWLNVWTQSEACVALVVACLPSLRTLLLSRSITGGSTDAAPAGYRYGSRKFGGGSNSYPRNSRIGSNNHVKLNDLSDSSHITKIEASKQPQVTTMYYEGNNSSEEVLRGTVPPATSQNHRVAVQTDISVTSHERAADAKEAF
ncbi:hypothetical protein AA313_de0209865 [Arthrobotrys entomopaga]|nr:hypothetical protein AA313_de0209865 [Arthrobotrys entomopaga]